MNREPKPIDNPRDIPAGLSDEERMAFLEEHGVSEHFLKNVEEASEEERPRPRTKPVNIRFDDFTLGRLKGLAERRNVGYQTLLKEFVVERLYEEEKREGILSADPEAKESRTPNEGAVRQVREAIRSPQRIKESMDDYRDVINNMFSYWQEVLQAAERDVEDDEK